MCPVSIEEILQYSCYWTISRHRAGTISIKKNREMIKMNHDNYQIVIYRKQHVKKPLSEIGFSIREKQLGLPRRKTQLQTLIFFLLNYKKYISMPRAGIEPATSGCLRRPYESGFGSFFLAPPLSYLGLLI